MQTEDTVIILIVVAATLCNVCHDRHTKCMLALALTLALSYQPILILETVNELIHVA